MVDWLELEQRRHAVHSLLEIHVAAARASIRAYRARSRGPLSFTAYLIGCLARAIDRDRRMAAIRHGRRRMLELILADARRRKRLTGTVLVTAVSLPGKGRAWGIPNGTHYPISLLIGGLHLGDDGRESVALTLTFGHDTVNGASSARFVRRFAPLVENGELIDEQP